MASGNGFEVAKAYVTIVPTMQGSQKTITEELTGITSSASESAGETSGKKFGESLANGLKTTGTIIAGALATATAGAVALGKGFIEATNSVASLGDEISKESAKMHISTTSYQELDFILTHFGSSIDVVKNGMKTLTAQAESNSDAFAQLGISTEELATLSQEDLFYRVIEGLQNCTDESERTVLAQELLGRSSIEMTNLFNASAEETEALRQQVHELGGVMSEEALKDAEAYQDAMTNMNTALDGLKNNMVSNFLPGVTKAMNGLAKVFSGDKSGIGEIKQGIEDTISKINDLAPDFIELGSSIITSLISGFAPMLPSIVSTLFDVLIQAIVVISSMIPEMMPSIISGIQGIMTALFQALPIVIQGVSNLIMALVTWLSEGDNVKMFVDGLIQMAVMIVGQISEILPVLLPAIVTIISEVVLALTSKDNINLLINAVLQICVAIFEALVNSVPVLIEFVIGLFDNLGELMASFLDWAGGLVAVGIEAIVNGIKLWLNNTKTFISNIGNAIRSGVTNFTSNVRNTITSWVDSIKNAINNWLTNLKNGFTNAFNTIRDKISDIKTKAQTLVSDLISKIGELPGKVVSIGKNLIEGLWSGISDKIEWVKNKIWGMGSAITNAIKGVFGIASPSKVFAEIGGYLAEGLGEGYEEGMKDVQADILSNSDNLTTSMTADVTAYASQGSILSGETNNFNGSPITINVYASEGQDVNTLAETIADKLEDMTRRRGVVYA